MKVLIVRNDKLGDFMLAWPAIALLKQQYPDAEITALVPVYTRPVAEVCSWIDNIIVDDRSSAIQISRILSRHRFDASISLFSELRTSFALWLSRIPVRVGPATKLAQIFLNRRLRQKRSRSLKPEYEYNVDLVRHFIHLNGDRPTQTPPPPYVSLDRSLLNTIREKYVREEKIDPKAKLVFIHPGSGGSATNLSIEQYADLADSISQSSNVHLVITAGPDELNIASELTRIMKSRNYSIYHSKEGLVNFINFIAICDIFISGSTGPLHIAGALNVKTAGFYPARRSATALRWQTINDECKRLSFMPDSYNGAEDMKKLDMNECARAIVEHL
jgi:ADP-heptose:LPS heptosyltransferase